MKSSVAGRKSVAVTFVLTAVVVLISTVTIAPKIYVAAFTMICPSSHRLRQSRLFVDGNGKMSIELLTDENRDALLRPMDDPSRPILVDAFAPWCGPCKLLDKVLQKAQPRYANKVDFCRWNVNDKNNTAQIKAHFIDNGYTLSKLPSLIVYRDGVPIAVRPGLANEFQLDDWLETTLPDVLERTFDENGIKMDPKHNIELQQADVKQSIADQRRIEVQQTNVKRSLPDQRAFSPLDFKSTILTERLRVLAKQSVQDDQEEEVPTICDDEIRCWELVEETLGWENRTVTPAASGLPKRTVA